MLLSRGRVESSFTGASAVGTKDASTQQMQSTRLNLAQLTSFLALLALSACGRSHSVTPPGARCEEQRLCYSVDPIGCCVGTTARVSVCDACPAGMAELRECRATGCEDPCRESSGSDRAGGEANIAPPQACRADLGAGCCGDYVERDECGRCPSGSIEEQACAGEVSRPLHVCYEAQGLGCCTNEVPANACGFCPPGAVPASECVEYYNFKDTAGDAPGFGPPGEGDDWPGDAGVEDRAPPRLDAGVVAHPSSDAGGRPIRDAAAFIPPDVGWVSPIPPLKHDAGPSDPPAGCFEHLGAGCCGDFVPPTACGYCPAGSIHSWSCTNFGPGCAVPVDR